MPSVIPSLLLLATAFSAVAAVPHDHDHSIDKALPGRWYHDDDHPVHALFKRGASTDGITYAAVGSPEWAAGYPQKVDTNALPQAWVNAYNAAKSAGKIPSNVPVATQADGENPTYGNLDPNGLVVCSATYKCRNPEDIWDAPDGVFGSSFDDGPLPTSQPLYEFLKQNNVISTHFHIGINILNNPNEFLYAWDTLQSDIAVHTWTHPYMTTLSDLELLGEFGWTMEIIHNSTGGRLPKFWRPPYGDADNRVRAIAKEVFGLTTVIWNQDTEDWSIGSPGGASRAEVNENLQKWITGTKSPGLIILEHELSNDTVGAFIQAFPLIAQNGWKFESLARINNTGVYQNSADHDATVIPASVGASVSQPASSSSATPTSSTASSASASSGAGGNNAASTTSTKGSQATGTDTPHNSADSKRVSPILACLVTLFSVAGAALVF